MGSYLSKAVTDKQSSDENNQYVKCGASAMQGWRIHQEDAHNVILDFDEKTSFFAVYDGHGGHEVAVFASSDLPNIVKSSDSYKKGDVGQALVTAFLEFDESITKEHVQCSLKEIAGNKAEEDSDNDGEELSHLCREASMPLEEVIAKYSHPSEFQSPNIRPPKMCSTSGCFNRAQDLDSSFEEFSGKNVSCNRAVKSYRCEHGLDTSSDFNDSSFLSSKDSNFSDSSFNEEDSDISGMTTECSTVGLSDLSDSKLGASHITVGLSDLSKLESSVNMDSLDDSKLTEQLEDSKVTEKLDDNKSTEKINTEVEKSKNVESVNEIDKSVNSTENSVKITENLVNFTDKSAAKPSLSNGISKDVDNLETKEIRENSVNLGKNLEKTTKEKEEIEKPNKVEMENRKNKLKSDENKPEIDKISNIESEQNGHVTDSPLLTDKIAENCPDKSEKSADKLENSDNKLEELKKTASKLEKSENCIDKVEKSPTKLEKVEKSTEKTEKLESNTDKSEISTDKSEISENSTDKSKNSTDKQITAEVESLKLDSSKINDSNSQVVKNEEKSNKKDVKKEESAVNTENCDMKADSKTWAETPDRTSVQQQLAETPKSPQSKENHVGPEKSDVATSEKGGICKSSGGKNKACGNSAKGKGKALLKNSVPVKPLSSRSHLRRDATNIYQKMATEAQQLCVQGHAIGIPENASGPGKVGIPEKTGIEEDSDSDMDDEDDNFENFIGCEHGTFHDDSDDSSLGEECSEEDSEEECEEEEEEELGEEEENIYNEFAMNMREEPGYDSGCTACVAVLKESTLYVANVGDSRAVVCRGDGMAYDMSVDHKPEDAIETERIKNAGGRITPDGRVNGGLNLSRALGDHSYKLNKIIKAEAQMISPMPDIKILNLTATDRFLIIACDGIWNSMTSQEACDFVTEKFKEEIQLSKVAEALFDDCLAPNACGDGTGCDNMTCIIVKFNPGFLPEIAQVNGTTNSLEKPVEVSSVNGATVEKPVESLSSSNGAPDLAEKKSSKTISAGETTNSVGESLKSQKIVQVDGALDSETPAFSNEQQILNKETKSPVKEHQSCIKELLIPTNQNKESHITIVQNGTKGSPEISKIDAVKSPSTDEPNSKRPLDHVQNGENEQNPEKKCKTEQV